MSSSKLNGIMILKDQKFSKEELLTYAQTLSDKSGEIQDKLLHWDFGPMMEMRFDRNAQNYLFSDEVVPFHWDGAFYREPSKLLFFCEESVGNGGETLFVNTELLWSSLTEEEKVKCEKVTLTYRTEKKAHYGGEIKVPLVQKHPRTGSIILRLAEEVETHLNPVTLNIIGIENADAFYQELRNKLYDPAFMYEHAWEKGDLLVCDNFTFLHGRRALGGNLKRSFKRIQIL
ncbi:TauD/TfdA dioxygenase family protein [Peredibacter starrii]|uniref:TauD/TfdA family dioxygenase n=1 Tax=Peredibacter starrii TaxID=28202 RepID=A0AAX4HUH0_9BACT|nr:TauD/TfdA family dioxygenase [Peredibacter starrii]WPU67024.1 TauD/TfdA family dioxygenase [Peredibacter starrii]